MENHNEIKELASQLKQPSGKKGLEVAQLMNQANMGMTRHAINCLNMLDNEVVLELGHGNGGHLKQLFEQAKNLTYRGIDISDLMHKEAKRINKTYVESNQASFHLYNGLNMPFLDNYFDKIFTVNTLYFWEDPKALLLELFRITRPNGMLSISFGQKIFMEDLPFVQYGFKLYDTDDVLKLIDQTPFKFLGADTQTETVESKTGVLVDRKFTTVSVKKIE